jgi:sugar/nucleoside kinase (ribokinase family)
LFKEIDGLIINDSEAEQLTEISNPITAARAIIQMGPRFVIVKKGEHGAVLVHKEGIAVVPAFPLDADGVIDPTGAGDSFAGGFMGHIAATGTLDFKTMQEGMAWGTVTASFTLGSFGLDGLVSTTQAALEARMSEFRTIARIC